MARRWERFYEDDQDAVSVVREFQGTGDTGPDPSEFLMFAFEKIKSILVAELRENSKFREAWNWAKKDFGLVEVNELDMVEKQLINVAAKSYSADVPHSSPMFSDFNRKTREMHQRIRPSSEYFYKSLYYFLYRACSSRPFSGQPKRKNSQARHILDTEINADTGVVYRGCNFKFDVKLHEDIMFNNYASTSLSRGIADDFAHACSENSKAMSETTFFVLTNVVHGFDLRAMSAFPEEEEMLLLPFETFQVLEVNDDRQMGTREVILRGSGQSMKIS